MAKKKVETCCPTSSLMASCKVEAIVSVDERGQMVLPKEVREKAGIQPGDKLAVIGWEKDGSVCCISLVKTESFASMLGEVLGPMLQEIIKK